MADFLLVLGPAGDHEFRLDGKDRLLGKLPAMDAETCVAVRIRKTLGENNAWITSDPLSPMTAAEKGLLRGLMIEDRPDDLDSALEGIHWEHTLLAVDHGITVAGNSEILPPLPADLRYLDFELTMMPNLRDLRSLNPLRNLVYLSLGDRAELDLTQLTCGPNLRFFDIQGATLTHLEAIAGWTAIRNLNLRDCDELNTIDFLKGLGELRTLNLSRNKNLKDIGPVSTLPNLTYLNIASWHIADLSPVAGLTHLTHLDLGGTQVRDLSPVANLSSLTDLDLTNTKVTDLSPVGRLPNLEKLAADNSAVDTLPSNRSAGWPPSCFPVNAA
ncbi:MAG: leucine-rich repeat domain-containing protein [Akkermansiaceae bacterium]|nr:leucine-rich repeat domain-containing protein [Akkermansiaceae bacterium]